MRKLPILLITALLFVDCKKTNTGSTQFIEIVHTGITTGMIPIIYITTKKVKLKVDYQPLMMERRLFGDSAKLTEQQKEAYVNTVYDKIVTDSQTFATIQKFILTHNQFYANAEHLNNDPAEDSYDIILNSLSKFSIYYKLKQHFLMELLTYLQQKKCDKNVITHLSYLR